MCNSSINLFSLLYCHRNCKMEALASQSSNFFVEKIPTQFSCEVRGNDKHDCCLCKLHSSEGNESFGTSTWKYRGSKSVPAGILHAVV